MENRTVPAPLSEPLLGQQPVINPAKTAGFSPVVHLLGVVLLALGIATTAYAGLRIVVDRRMAELYQDEVSATGWTILVIGLVAMATGAVLVVASERRA